MEKEIKFPIDKKIMKELLSKAMSRTMREGSVDVIDFNPEELSSYDKDFSVYRTNLTFDFPKPKKIINVPPIVAIKIYSNEGNEGFRDYCRMEYEIEQKMLGLSSDLACRKPDGKRVRVYPLSFSDSVPECDKYLCIIREFINGDSLSKQVLDKKEKEEKIYWKDVNGTISTLASLHINNPWLIERVNLPKYGEGFMSDIAIQQIERIAHANGRGFLEEELKKELKTRFLKLFSKYLSKEGLIRVINGDLNVSPRNATNSILLNAGKTSIGPFTDDLALYSDPIFSSVLNSDGEEMDLYARGDATIKDYLTSYEAFEYIYQYRGFPKTLSKDFLTASFFASALRGGIKGVSTAFTYGNKFLKHPQKDLNLQEIAESYASNVYDSLNFLRENGDREDRQIVNELECLLQYSSLYFPYERTKHRNVDRCPISIIAKYKEICATPQEETKLTKAPQQNRSLESA